MVGPNAVVVTERREQAPTRRVVYEPRENGQYYVRIEEVWRAAKGDWHEMGSETVADVVIGR